MDASGLLTVIAVLLAGAALLSPRTLLDLKIRITGKDNFIFLLLSAFSLYLLFFDVLKKNGLVLPIPWLWGFDQKSSLLAISLLLMVFIAVKFKETRLPKSSIKRLGEVFNQLTKDGNFKDVSFLFEKYHEDLLSYLSFRPWYVKLHDFIVPNYYPRLILQQDNGWLGKLNRAKNNLKYEIANLIPSTYWLSEEVDKIIVSLFKSRNLAIYLSENYPVLGLKVLHKSIGIEDINRDEFINLLLENNHSPLYRELSQCLYVNESNCYTVDVSNSTLRYLLEDVSTCYELEIYTPIKKHAIDIIKKERGSNSIYNKPCDSFIGSNERWDCHVYMSIFMFDVMVRESIEQETQKHLYPNYVFHFAKEIIDSINNHETVDMKSEFPTRYYFLLYECFSAMASWVNMFKNKEGYSYNFNIELILESLGMMTYYVLETDKFDDIKKAYFFSIVLSTIRSLDEAKQEQYSKKIAKHVTSLHEFKKPAQQQLDTINRLKKLVINEHFLFSSLIDKHFSPKIKEATSDNG
ncbi:hypothetical protein ACQKP8_05525 [Photobacterium alginatilyticum]|uniref:hypothetical protein n=1 Tax=Photobacterium alginatilyticum TaxID=1775171 RepID=UPI004068F552